MQFSVGFVQRSRCSMIGTYFEHELCCHVVRDTPFEKASL